MRYKVKAPSQSAFYAVRKALDAAQAHIWLVSERRLFVATDDLAADVQRQLRDLGAVVSPDHQYNADAF